MKKNKEPKEMTLEEALLDPSFAPFHELIRAVKDKPNKDIFPKKYEMCVIDAAMVTMVALVDNNPNISFRKALKGVIKNLPKDITDVLFTKVIKQALEEWPERLAAAQPINQVQIPEHSTQQALVMA